MTDGDRRAELARVARGLRLHLERQEAEGLGETLARGAAKVMASRQKAGATAAERPATAGRTPRTEAASAAPMPDTIPGASRIAIAGREEVDLFGARQEWSDRAGRTVKPAPSFAHEFPVADPSDFEKISVPALAPAGTARAAIVGASMPVLDQVAGEARACRKCGLCETRTQAVPGVGSAASGIVFVGEAPGADEDRKGEPFVGRAGELLTKIIKAMDDASLIPGVSLTRETVYICNVLKCRPPENRNPLPHEVESCSPYLERQLDALKPRIICCLGKFAAELLVGVKGTSTIGGLRGKVYRYRGAKLIVTYHPAACLRNPNYKRPVWEDMQLLAREYLTD